MMTLPPTYPYEINEKIDNRYLVKRKSEGGFGDIYFCIDQVLKMDVVLKTFKSEEFSRNNFQTLIKEAEKWVRLGKHPNIVRLHNIKFVSKRVYIILEWVKNPSAHGPTLYEHIHHVDIAREEAISIIIDALNGLIHGASKIQNFCHLDLTPLNLLIGPNGAKITDFGLTSSALATNYAGTIGYLSPEHQMGFENIDKRADIFAIGCILYELLTKKRLFGRGKLTYEIPKKAKKIEKNEQIDSNLKKIIQKCIKFEREERYQEYHDLLNDLQTINRSNAQIQNNETEYSALDFFITGNAFHQLYNLQNDDSFEGIKQKDYCADVESNYKKSLDLDPSFLPALGNLYFFYLASQNPLYEQIWISLQKYPTILSNDKRFLIFGENEAQIDRKFILFHDAKKKIREAFNLFGNQLDGSQVAKDAREILDELLSIVPDCAEAYLLLGNLDYVMHDIDSAINNLIGAIAVNAHFLPAYEFLIELTKAYDRLDIMNKYIGLKKRHCHS